MGKRRFELPPDLPSQPKKFSRRRFLVGWEAEIYTSWLDEFRKRLETNPLEQESWHDDPWRNRALPRSEAERLVRTSGIPEEARMAFLYKISVVCEMLGVALVPAGTLTAWVGHAAGTWIAAGGAASIVAGAFIALGKNIKDRVKPP